MGDINPFLIAAKMVVLILSLSVHEWAHAEAAYRLGDDTADRMGRRTLNPIAHIDPIGTILFPLMGMLGGIGFGWAKPVLTQPRLFDRWISMRAGSAIVAFAGPLSNLLLALGSFLLFFALVGTGLVKITQPEWQMMFVMVFGTNLALAMFNLLPMPPLDGGWILAWLMPESKRDVMEWMERNGFMILIALILAPTLTGGLITPIQWLLTPVFYLLSGAMTVLFELQMG